MSDRRYPFAPLASAMGFTEATAIRELGIGGSRAKRLRNEGLTVDLADRYATRAGFHPSEVWPTWADDAEVDRRAALNAGERRRYQTDAEKRARRLEASRRYWQENHEYVLAQKRKRQAELDPAIKKERRRAHYLRHREAILAKKRAAHAARRVQVEIDATKYPFYKTSPSGAGTEPMALREPSAAANPSHLDEKVA